MLKMGEVINTEKAIPKIDPFSENAQKADGKPHVYYQWLSEVAFDCAFQNRKFDGQIGEGGPPNTDDEIMHLSPEKRSKNSASALENSPNLKYPMFLGILLCAGAFLAFPLLNLLRAPKPFLLIPILIVLAAQASSFHFYLRPELFSAFMFSLELLIVNSTRLACQANPNHRITFWLIIQVSILMIIWCNLHCGFVLGLIVLLIFAVIQTLSLSQFESKRNVWLAFAFGTLCTLINPWGIDLWIYLFKLFTSPIGSRVEELQPLSVSELFGHTYGLYTIFATATLGVLIYAFLRLKRSKKQSALLLSFVVVAMVLVMGIGARRLIPFACILGVFEWTLIMSILFLSTSSGQETPAKQGKLLNNFAPILCTLVFVSALLGTWWESNLFKLQLPQSSYGFPPPYEAIKNLQIASRNKGEEISGQCLNDPQFGDMMIYYLGRDSRVFIDTRFDIYPDKIVFDFLTMANCQNGWDKLLDQYKIAWIFLPHHTQLATYARNHPESWTTIYSDDSALISRRKIESPKTGVIEKP